VTAICGGKSAATDNSSAGPSPEVTILRTRNISFGHNIVARLASYCSYLVGTLWLGIRMRRPDCVVTLTTPPVLPVIGAVFCLVRGSRHVIWEMDIYPDIATDIGYVRKNGAIEVVVGAIIDWSRRHAHAIIVLGDEMRSRLVARGISESKILVAESWACGKDILPMAFLDGPLTVHYSGNLGLAHEVATISAVIERLANHPRFRFIISGGGPRRPRLESLCQARSIKNVEFRRYCTNAKLGESLADGHLGLVTQIPETLGSVIPSKIYGIMAAGRPLLYIGPTKSTPASHIRTFKCGWHIQAGDVEGVISLLHHLDLNRHLLREAGERGRSAFEQHFDLPIGVARVEDIVCGRA